MPKLLKDPTLKPEYIAQPLVKSDGRWESCCSVFDRTLRGFQNGRSQDWKDNMNCDLHCTNIDNLTTSQ